MKENYQKILDKTIENIASEGIKMPTLLLHSCCAPCSSYVIEYLTNYFDITVFYYNPNIHPQEEYEFRVKEQERFINEIPHKNKVELLVGSYEQDEFYSAVKGLENEPEGGERCFTCYALRLEKTAQLAKEKNFDYFTTTLTISPLKNAEKMNEIGGELGKKYGVNYLLSDFKKREGYKRSTELSTIYGLYRQNYCGCIYSIC